MFEEPFASTDNLDQVGSAEHRAIAREAVAKSPVLLKNSGDVLPLGKDANIYVAGRNADNIGNQAGGWTIQWQGASGDIIPGTTILAAPEGSIYVVFQQATGYAAPVWPPVDGSQRPMMHFDFQVGDLDAGVVAPDPRRYRWTSSSRPP